MSQCICQNRNKQLCQNLNPTTPAIQYTGCVLISEKEIVKRIKILNPSEAEQLFCVRGQKNMHHRIKILIYTYFLYRKLIVVST